MTQTLVEALTSTPEGMASFQQERLILAVTELIYALMEEQGVTKADLAARLGKSKPFVTQLLDGRANMTLRTVSDVLHALGKSLDVTARDLSVGAAPPLEVRQPDLKGRANRSLKVLKFTTESPHSRGRFQAPPKKLPVPA